MGNLWINIRLGCYHLQVGRDRPWVRVQKNWYWANGAWREKIFCVYVIFGHYL